MGLATGLAGAGIGMQIVYPLLRDEWLRLVTLGSVMALAAAAVVHAAAVRGLRWAVAMLAVVAGTGWTAEALGVATGIPFGSYAYADSLGPKVLAVPLLVPLAWVMTAYPAYLVGQRLAGPRGGWLIGAWTLTAWDLFLDPQMVEAGHWSWAFPTPALPGISGIPLTNYAGWLVTGAVMMLLLTALRPLEPADRPPGRPPHDVLPLVVLTWTYASQLVGNVVFFGRPAVAAWGGIAMGLTVIPAVLVMRRDTRREVRPEVRPEVGQEVRREDPPARHPVDRSDQGR
jgi:putative membrane protein